MTTARPMACSNERQSATAASTAPQSIAVRDERPFPASDAFLTTTCSTNLRTRSNDPTSKKEESMTEVDPPRGASSDRTTVSALTTDGRFSGARASVEKSVRVCKALFTISVLAERRALQALGDLVQSLLGT